MKRNKMCPICYLKSLFRSKVVITEEKDEFVNDVRKTPLMGWSSWNIFRNHVDEEKILQIGKAMVDTGLKDCGYEYVNIDDNWQSGERDENGDIIPDYALFPNGMKYVADELNKMGLKLGLYSSNGTNTCEDLPASLGNERKDAYTYAKFGAEYLKYDYCHNIKISPYAPLIYGIEIMDLETHEKEIILCSNAKLDGSAKFMPDRKVDGGQYISGLDRGLGKAIFKVDSDSDKKAVITILVRKYGKKYNKALFVKVNGEKAKLLSIPPQKKINVTSRFQTIVEFKKGKNEIELYNPMSEKYVSAKIQYRLMGESLKEAANKLAKEENREVKPIILGICEWGFNRPWRWGKESGNMWRTTPDIRPIWPWIMLIYARNVRLYNYASSRHFNDPDSLEVGNGKLTYNQNVSHFALWCMMASPLILGTDIRTIPDNVLKIFSNKDLIAINQDTLCKQAKRVEKKNRVDYLIKPLENGNIAIAFFNHGGKRNFSFDFSKAIEDEYIGADDISKYTKKDVLGTADINGNTITGNLDKHATTVIILEKK
ncbi:MAG: alpha-galactosidase [Clostridia bacterium]|nr:alpha-galactosidase [Clostridia bacterium]